MPSARKGGSDGVDADVEPDADIIELGEIDLELDEDDRLIVADGDDEYVDRYASADFVGSVVALMADYNGQAVAERRAALVDSARDESARAAAPCWPGCMADRLGMVPVFKYDKVLVADDRPSLQELERQLWGSDGFAPRELALEITFLKDASKYGMGGDAWRPLRPPAGAASTFTIRSVIDPAERHCSLPEEACGSLRINSGKFSRPAGAPPLSDTVRLLPGDRVQLVKVDRGGGPDSFEEFVPDPARIAKEAGIASPGEADRIAEEMGLQWSAEFVAGIRAAAAEAAEKLAPGPEGWVSVDAPRAREGGELQPQASVPPDADVVAAKAAIDKRLSALKAPSLSKKKRGGGTVVRVYTDPAVFARDEASPDATRGEEFDDTPRGVLRAALALPARGATIEERIREASDSRLTEAQIRNVARGGKRIEVGDRVSLRVSGIEHEYMRAREEKTGALFWALQTVRQVGLDSGKAECAEPDNVCYGAAPTPAEIAAFRRELLKEASDRLKRAARPFRPDEATVTRVRIAMTDRGTYASSPHATARAEARYLSDARDTHETAFRPVAPSPPPAEDSPESDAGGKYRELAASTLLAVLFPSGVRLPKQIDGARWLVRLAVPGDPRYDELDAGGGTDPLRLKFLVDAALNAAAVAVLLADASPEDAQAMLAAADVTAFIESPKAAAAWAAAVKKMLTAEIIATEGEALRARSPLLDHVAEVAMARGHERGKIDRVPASKLGDWAGFRPLARDIPDAGARDAVALAAASRAGPPDDPPAGVRDRAASRLSAALKAIGLPERHPDRASVDAFSKSSSPEFAGALRAATREAFAALGKISSGSRDPALARFKRISRAAARDALAKTAGSRESLRLDAGDSLGAWLDLAESADPDFGSWMAASLASRARAALADVDSLLSRMEAAKEAIKNEKIDFFENALDPEEQATLAELRRVGLQTADEQIIAFDARGRAAADAEEEAGEDAEEAYDTMADYEDDES